LVTPRFLFLCFPLLLLLFFPFFFLFLLPLFSPVPSLFVTGFLIVFLLYLFVPLFFTLLYYFTGTLKSLRLLLSSHQLLSVLDCVSSSFRASYFLCLFPAHLGLQHVSLLRKNRFTLAALPARFRRLGLFFVGKGRREVLWYVVLHYLLFPLVLSIICPQKSRLFFFSYSSTQYTSPTSSLTSLWDL
jgi:hypothetical protein